MIAVVLKNFVLFLMLLLISHYTIQLHTVDNSTPLVARKQPKPRRPVITVEEEEACSLPEGGRRDEGMQELYDFVFEDKEAPKNLENMYANQIQVSRTTGGDPDSIDSFVSSSKTKAAPPESSLYVSSGGYEVVGSLEDEDDTGMFLPASASSGEFSSNLFKI
jgi:hypothetical protein